VRVRQFLVVIAAVLTARGAQSQHAHGGCNPAQTCLGASAIGLLSHVNTLGADGRTFNEGYVTQPMLAGSWSLAGGRLQALGIVNVEGITLERGELSPGTYGEGYIDRRHPHTYLHEAMLGSELALGPARLSLFVGKGIVPFGTEDPMMRPFVRYPANHHLAQVMERAQVVAAARVGAVGLEFSRFGGDEPESPSDFPNPDRLWDSWSARLSAFAPNLEASASVARVKSPEYAAGFGLNQNKRAASVRYSGSTESRISYAMVEWARTSEWLGPRKDLWVFSSALAEVAAPTPVGQLALRLERTSRPEEHRDQSPFRSMRPLLDFGIVGRTRWETVTVGWSRFSAGHSRVQVVPFGEVSYSRARPLERVVIASPADAFGGLRLISISGGVRVGLGRQRTRMGRYGAAA
jgi:hypothetical protein